MQRNSMNKRKASSKWPPVGTKDRRLHHRRPLPQQHSIEELALKSCVVVATDGLETWILLKELLTGMQQGCLLYFPIKIFQPHFRK